MKHFPSAVLMLLLFAAMLIFPRSVFEGASEGLLLWFQIVFPTLFPFLVVTSLLLKSGSIRFIARIFGRLFGRIFRVSSNGTFAVLAGFLCGYPMGAKVTADLLRSGHISRQEAGYLLSFCNNTSPVFILNFIVWKTFGRDDLLLPTLLILILIPIFLSFVFRIFYLGGDSCFADLSPMASDRREQKKFDFSLIDSCMMDSFESIVKVGGYIILFSVLLYLLQELPLKGPLFTALAPALEMTNGILMLKSSVPDLHLSYPAVLGLTSFGGLCSIAQTQCMLDGTGLSILPYIAEKLAASAAASLAAFLYIFVRYVS